MTSRPRLGPLASLGVAVVLAVTAGCSGSEGSGGSGSADAAQDGPALPSADRLAAYFEAVASYDPELLAEAEQIAAEGSPAQDYAAYLGGYAASAVAAAQAVRGAEVEEVEGGYRACGGTGTPEECVVWAGLEGEGGLLTAFTVNDVPLEDSLVDLGDQPAVAADGLYTVQPDHAYRSPQSGTLFVVVTVSAFDVPLSPRPGTYIEDDLILDGVETRAPASVGAGEALPVVLAFPDAQEAALDGQVTFELRLGEQRTESIGFGLADPAA